MATVTNDKATSRGDDDMIQQNSAAAIDKVWPSSPMHPLNWPLSKRWKNALIISVTGFLSTLGSSILVPAAPYMQDEWLVNSRELLTLATTAMYVLGLGAGPFLFAPISELYGRQVAYASSMIGFFAFNLGCCFAPSFAGVFGSSGPGLGVATISDLFIPRERGRVISVYAIGPLLGPSLGSILGSYITLVYWRWTLRILTIAVAINVGAVILFMDETYAPVLEQAWRESPNDADEEMCVGAKDKVRAVFRPKPEAKSVIIRTFTRPPRMLINPVCAIFVMYYAYIYSIIYIYLVSLPLLFSQHDPPTGIFTYGWTRKTQGLCYIGLMLGFLSAAIVASNCADKIYKGCCKRYKSEGQPEFRLIGMLLFPVGVLVWAWTAEAQTHWIVPLIGSYILAFGLMLAFNSIQNFIVDAFVPFSAAAMAAATFMRSLVGCVLPIFSDSLFINLGYGVGGTILACISLPAIPAPFVLFMFGQRLRERYKFVN
ncbi:hypothetical protein OIO90_006325 [Microbotryomycetes sp. JL221]|nr:hypothetical protein OIO90_006325 [Microbotryomycetes sp. JL221]